jgi:5-formyltetrahydrofolate cyclo-ligase
MVRGEGRRWVRAGDAWLSRARTCRGSRGEERERLSGKPEIRERVWALLTERGVGRFPLPLHDRIPNFAGAEAAARRLTELPEWKEARRIKCNPDAPQRAVRLAALRQGKTVVMAVPRLRAARCFLRLDPRRLAGKLAQAATIKGASALGVPVSPAQIGRIDLIVAGSVAVNPTGARLGKGGGYSDLEWALARALGVVNDQTPVVTTVHELQVLDQAIPMTTHDVPLDIIATPERVIRTRRRPTKPAGIFWGELSEAQLAEMPALAKLQARRASGARQAAKRSSRSAGVSAKSSKPPYSGLTKRSRTAWSITRRSPSQ